MLALLAACELVVGADFDDKTLLAPSTSTSSSGGGALPQNGSLPDAVVVVLEP